MNARPADSWASGAVHLGPRRYLSVVKKATTADEQAFWEERWRTTPEWRATVLLNISRCFSHWFIASATVGGHGLSYELASDRKADLIRDCLEAAGAVVEQSGRRLLIRW